MVISDDLNTITVEKVNLSNANHVTAFLSLMNDYMLDNMGLKCKMPEKLGVKMVEGLLKQTNYHGFFMKQNLEYIALANCFVGFSTFKAKQLINIHDFIVSPQCRGKGIGEKLLTAISTFGVEHDYCKITLEVRYDNPIAQKLYKKVGFTECNPPMHFWQKLL